MAKKKYLLHPKHPLRTFLYIIVALGFVVGGVVTFIASQTGTELRSKAAGPSCSHPNENTLPWLTSFVNLRGVAGMETNATMQAVDEDTGSQDLRGGDDLSVIASDIPGSFQGFTYSCNPTTFNYDSSKRIATCRIRFTPRQAGTFPVTFQAKDNCGGVGTPQKPNFIIADSGSSGQLHYRWDFNGLSNENWWPNGVNIGGPTDVRDGYLNLHCSSILCGAESLNYRKKSSEFILGRGRKTLTMNLRVTDPTQTIPPRPFVGFVNTTLDTRQVGDPSERRSGAWFHGVSDGQFQEVRVTLPWVDVINIAWFKVYFKGLPGKSKISIDWISLDADSSNLTPPEALGKPPFWGTFYAENYLTVGKALRQTKTTNTISANDPDPGDSITIEAIGLPPGLSVSCPETVDNLSTPFARKVVCRMNGTPTSVGRFPVTWVAKDSRGLVGLPKYNSYITVR